MPCVTQGDINGEERGVEVSGLGFLGFLSCKGAFRKVAAWAQVAWGRPHTAGQLTWSEPPTASGSCGNPTRTPAPPRPR